MFWIALGLTVAGLVLTAALEARHRRGVALAAVGAAVAAVAAVGAASIGIFLLPVAAALLGGAALAARRSRPHHLTTR